MSLDLPIRELKSRETISFVPMTTYFGRAGFVFCLKYEDIKLTNIFITPKQQPFSKERFVINCYENIKYLFTTSWIHKYIQPPDIWRHFWCPDHQAPAFELYVPNNSDCFLVDMCSDTVMIIFDKKESDLERPSSLLFCL